MEKLKLKINEIDFTSIGSYMDNNDGISHYIPDNDNAENWRVFFKSEEPIIILWALSALEEDEFDINPRFVQKLIESSGDKLVSFLRKYCWKNILDDMFIDFIFGPYSEYAGNNRFPKIIYKGNTLKQECFDFGNHVFINSNRYAEFIKELDTLTELMIQNVKEM